MAIPSSGTINLGMLIAEFGGGDNLRDFYRGGGLVPDIAANAGIPTSGQINLRQFLGATAVQVGAPSPMNFNGVTNLAANTTGFRLETTGVVNKIQNASLQATSYRWAQGTFTPGDYEAYLAPTSGTITSGTVNTWLALSTGRSWEVLRAANGITNVTATLTIRRIAGSVVMSTSTINIQSERSNNN